jgi:outer membrane protein assembly factor BamB
MNLGWPKFKMRSLLLGVIAAMAFTGAMTPPVCAQLATSAWPMYRYNPAHTGQSIFDTSANNGAFKWFFEVGGPLTSSPAIGVDGTIYVGDEESGPGGFLPSHVYAVNPDGSRKWSFPISGIVSYSSAAIGADGTIYVGDEDSTSSAAGHLYAINADGSEKWVFQTLGLIPSSPAIGADGTIYVGDEFSTGAGSAASHLYAINPDGSQKWAFQTNGFVFSSPAIGADGTIYVGDGETAEASNVYAINPDGSEKWAFQTGGFVFSSPAVGADGTVYVGADDFNLYAINPDGTEKWAFRTEFLVDSSPAVSADGTIYVGSDDSYVYAINPDGTQKWAFSAGFVVASSPAIGADGTIYIAAEDPQLSLGFGLTFLYAINPDGTEKWSFPTDSFQNSSPSIGADGTIYIGSSDGRLYAVGEGTNPSTTVALPASFDFGPSAGTCSTATVKIKNTGTSPLLMFDAELSGNQTVEFSAATCKKARGHGVAGSAFAGGLIEPGVQCLLSINAFPSKVGSYGETLKFTDNVGTGTQTVMLRGVAEPAVTVSAKSALSFGRVRLGSFVTQFITLHSNDKRGTAFAKSGFANGARTTSERTNGISGPPPPKNNCTSGFGSDIEIMEGVNGGSNAADFAIVEGGTCGRTGFTNLPRGGASCTLKIQFKPSATGNESAVLYVDDFSSFGLIYDSFSIKLRGSGF